MHRNLLYLLRLLFTSHKLFNELKAPFVFSIRPKVSAEKTTDMQNGNGSVYSNSNHLVKPTRSRQRSRSPNPMPPRPNPFTVPHQPKVSHYESVNVRIGFDPQV